MTTEVANLKLKVGDFVFWRGEETTDMPGEIIGLCRMGGSGTGTNALGFLVVFNGPCSFKEPFAIEESSLRLSSPLEALACQAEKQT